MQLASMIARLREQSSAVCGACELDHRGGTIALPVVGTNCEIQAGLTRRSSGRRWTPGLLRPGVAAEGLFPAVAVPAPVVLVLVVLVLAVVVLLVPVVIAIVVPVVPVAAVAVMVIPVMVAVVTVAITMVPTIVVVVVTVAIAMVATIVIVAVRVVAVILALALAFALAAVFLALVIVVRRNDAAATGKDVVRIHRHRAVDRQQSPGNGDAGRRSDTGLRQNVAGESVPVPSVAELPTCQNTFAPLQVPPGRTMTAAAARRCQRASDLEDPRTPPARTSAPVNCADDEKQ